jgi:predicted acylesterase/phospholipase RssA/CRP-like cAMP-binding protein
MKNDSQNHANPESDLTSSQQGIANILKESELFRFDQNKASKLAPLIKQIDLDANQVLFRQGDHSDCAYLLTSGCLTAFAELNDGREEMVGTIWSGETVGEMGLLSGQPRSLSIKAIQSSSLLQLDKSLIENLPQEALLRFFQSLTKRAHTTIKHFYSIDYFPEQIAIAPWTSNLDVTRVAQELQHHWPPNLACQLVDPTGRIISPSLSSSLQSTRRETKFVLIDPANRQEAATICSKSERILFIADASKPNALNSGSQELNDRPDLCGLPKDLLLLHPESILGTQNFLEGANFTRHYQVRKQHVNDLKRVARILSGQAVGVTLGGGGVKGWAHIGTLRAIQEAGCPIDAIGGASAGAIMGALWLMADNHEDYIKRFERLLKIAGNQLALPNLTFPVVSLFNGKRWNNALQDAYGDCLIEELPINFHCVSCNFRTETQAVHTSGSLRKWVRASSSIPGLFPPVINDEDMYVDGGVVNNLPVDAMRNFLGGGSKIIAIDIGQPKNSQLPPYCPLAVNPFEALRLRRKAKKQNKVVPSLNETFLRSLMMGSQSKVNENAKLANLLVRPKLSAGDMLSTENHTQMMREGYEATKKALSESDLSFGAL